MQNKITYIPGWMNRAEYDNFSPGLDIWGSKIDVNKRIETDVIVAHSLGCHFTLLNWEKNRNARLVLVNPVLRKMPLWKWVWSWLRFLFTEGIRFANPKRISMLLQFVWKISMTIRFLMTDVEKILDLIEKENIFVIIGNDDYYLCNEEVCKLLESKGINYAVVEGMGHNWEKEKIQPIIENYI